MQRAAGFAEQVAAAEEVGAVVDVASVGRASAGGDEPGVAELGEVVRDEVLRLADELGELTDAPIAAAELGDQLPAVRIGDQGEDCRRRERGRHHIAKLHQTGLIRQTRSMGSA